MGHAHFEPPPSVHPRAPAKPLGHWSPEVARSAPHQLPIILPTAAAVDVVGGHVPALLRRGHERQFGDQPTSASLAPSTAGAANPSKADWSFRYSPGAVPSAVPSALSPRATTPRWLDSSARSQLERDARQGSSALAALISPRVLLGSTTTMGASAIASASHSVHGSRAPSRPVSRAMTPALGPVSPVLEANGRLRACRPALDEGPPSRPITGPGLLRSRYTSRSSVLPVHTTCRNVSTAGGETSRHTRRTRSSEF